MNQFSPQFAIISKLKKIVTKTSTMLKGDKTAGITEAIARKIQKGAYEAEFRKDKESKTPPYLTIAEQLQSNNSQIYRASVYALRNIAKNEEKSKDAILEILQKSAEKKSKNAELYNYTLDKIKEIESYYELKRKNKKSKK